MDDDSRQRKASSFFFGILKLEYDLIIFIYLTGFIIDLFGYLFSKFSFGFWSANTTATTVCAQQLPSRGFALTFLKQTSQNYLYASPKNTMLQCYILSDHRKILSHFCVKIYFLGSCKGWFLVQRYFYTQYFNVPFPTHDMSLEEKNVFFFSR